VVVEEAVAGEALAGAEVVLAVEQLVEALGAEV
jgi:hypothetical protein